MDMDGVVVAGTVADDNDDVGFDDDKDSLVGCKVNDDELLEQEVEEVAGNELDALDYAEDTPVAQVDSD